jgi:hypothetical protein
MYCTRREDGVVGDCNLLGRIKAKLKVKFALTCHKDMRVRGAGVPLPSLHTRRWMWVGGQSTARRLTHWKDTVSNVSEVRSDSRTVRNGEENLTPTGVQNPDLPLRR